MSSYNGSSIKVLKELEAVRQRPGMYIGSTGPDGVRHLLFEVADNANDEAMIGEADNVEVYAFEDGTVKVVDNGRGIPVDIHPEEGVSAAILIFTILHAGGKFDNNSYQFAGGLHGVGASVVNALSDFLTLEVKRDGKIYKLEFETGEPKSCEPEVIGECDPNDTGTTVTYRPTPEIFQSAVDEGGFVIPESDILEYLFNKSCLAENVKFTLDYMGKKTTYVTSDGLGTLLNIPKDKTLEEQGALHDVRFSMRGEHLHKGKKLVKTAKKSPTGKSQYESVEEEIQTEIGLMFFNRYNQPYVKSFVNNIETKTHGKHVAGVKDGLFELVKAHALRRKEKIKFTAEDVVAGAHIVVLQKMQNAEFGGQTKSSLTANKGLVASKKEVVQFMSVYMDQNPDFADALLKKTIGAAAARERQEQVRIEAEKDSISVNNQLSGKLTDCESRDLLENELIMVEGDSAGGSAKEGRCRVSQAILPLRGKILNTDKEGALERVINSDQIQMIYSAAGTSIAHDFDYSKLRYGKIIIMTDADVDGLHIRTLLLTFFFGFMRELVEKGHIYIAVPPLFKLEPKSGKGKTRYFINEEELEAAYPEGIPSRYHLGRFKGLGEMNPEQLRVTTLDKDNRILYQVAYNPETDVDEATEMFKTLMGKDVSVRRKFIEENVSFEEVESE